MFLFALVTVPEPFRRILLALDILAMHPDNGRPLLIMLLALRKNAAADILLPIQFELVGPDQRVVGDVISARTDR